MPLVCPAELEDFSGGPRAYEEAALVLHEGIGLGCVGGRSVVGPARVVVSEYAGVIEIESRTVEVAVVYAEGFDAAAGVSEIGPRGIAFVDEEARGRV